MMHMKTKTKSVTASKTINVPMTALQVSSICDMLRQLVLGELPVEEEEMGNRDAIRRWRACGRDRFVKLATYRGRMNTATAKELFKQMDEDANLLEQLNDALADGVLSDSRRPFAQEVAS